MSRTQLLKLFAAVIAPLLSCATQAADPSPAAELPKHQPTMKMNEPMPTGMAKEGMKKGDVKSSADKKAKAMRPMMEQEEKAMPREKPKP